MLERRYNHSSSLLSFTKNVIKHSKRVKDYNEEKKKQKTHKFPPHLSIFSQDRKKFNFNVILIWNKNVKTSHRRSTQKFWERKFIVRCHCRSFNNFLSFFIFYWENGRKNVADGLREWSAGMSYCQIIVFSVAQTNKARESNVQNEFSFAIRAPNFRTTKE